jgi:ribosomal protein L20
LGSPTGNRSPNTSYNSNNKSHNNNNSNNNSASQDMSYRQMTSLEILRHHFAATPQDERVFYEFVELLAKQQLAIDVKEIADLAIRDALDQQLLAKYGDVSLSHAHEDGMDDRSYQSRQSDEPEQKPVKETHATRHPEPQPQQQPHPQPQQQPESAHVAKEHPMQVHGDEKATPVEQHPQPVRSSHEEQQPKIVEPKDEQSAPAKHHDASEPKTPVHPPETPVAAHSAEGQRRVADDHEQHQQPVPKQVD